MNERWQITHHNQTSEDFEIWLRVVRRAPSPARLWVVAEVSDRRDADLMFKLVQARVAWRALYRLYGPWVDAELFDQVGEGPDAVPLPRLPLNPL